MPSPDEPALRGLLFAKQFPNPAEPLRGVFVAEQLRATRDAVDWRVIAPAPWAPGWLAGLLGKPHIAEREGAFEGVAVSRPRYPVLPRRLLYATVAGAMARGSRDAFARVMREHRPGFAHVHALYPSGEALRRLVERAGLPYVLSVHGSDLYSNLPRPRWRAAIRRAAHGAAAIVCVSPSLARDVVAELGVPAERVHTIPDTYDAARFAYREHASHDGPLRLVSVGRLVPVKGHDVLLHAMGTAVRGGADLTLSLVGAGPEAARLAGLARDEGLGDRVRMTGALSGEALAAELAVADAFVLPSRREGFGVALIEALACGLPALATRSGGPQDIIAEGDGLLVAPDDAVSLADGLVALATVLPRFDRAAIAARARERFSPQSVGVRLVEVYRQVASPDVATRGGAR